MALASVCPSVTLLYCVKTVQARITKSSLWAASRTPVYRDEISYLWVKVSPRTRASNRGTPFLKNVILPLLALIVWKRLQIGTDLPHIITSTGDRLFRFVNIDNLKRPWPLPLPPKKGRVIVNFSQFLAAAHISTANCDEMAGDRPRQPVHEIFSIKRRF